MSSVRCAKSVSDLISVIRSSYCDQSFSGSINASLTRLAASGTSSVSVDSAGVVSVLLLSVVSVVVLGVVFFAQAAQNETIITATSSSARIFFIS